MNHTIDGHTKLIGLIADPIGHVRTPQALNAKWHDENANYVTIPLHVSAQNLSQMVQGLVGVKNFMGLIATIPHKQALAELCTQTSDSVQISGAANVARITPKGELVGENFDGCGFADGLEYQGHFIARKHVRLIGAGGAASAIALEVIRRGCDRLAIVNRSRDKAEALTARIQSVFPDANITVCQKEKDDARADMVINATSLGMRENDDAPSTMYNCAPHAVAAEVIMVPEETLFLREAHKNGFAIHHGHHMMKQQLKLISQFLGVF